LFTTDDLRKDKLVPLEITTPTLPDATVNVAYWQPLNSRGAGANPLWAAQGLPAGLVIDAHNGTVHGTPTAAQVAAPVAVTLSDATGKSVTKALTLTVRPAP
jgi:2',3'-cyclic-nucleotide 2'-phosphodiesterase/3'-nucleotidase/5'-nucleotidase